jgi:hypothetical protein
MADRDSTDARSADADATDSSQAIIDEIRRTPGEWLYHYTTLATALVFVLPSLTLRLSPFSAMRDPREFKRWWTSAVGFAEDMDAWTRAVARADDQANVLRDQFKLVSLTTDTEQSATDIFERGFARSRLWELYADQGRGVCLVLRRESAISSISQQLASRGHADHGPVEYRNEPLARAVNLLIDGEDDVDSIADRIIENHLHRLFLTKNKEWESEREYRFIVRTHEQHEYVSIRDLLAAIVLGPEARDAQFVMRLVANELDIGLGWLEWNNNDPHLIGLPRIESEAIRSRRLYWQTDRARRQVSGSGFPPRCPEDRGRMRTSETAKTRADMSGRAAPTLARATLRGLLAS